MYKSKEKLEKLEREKKKTKAKRKGNNKRSSVNYLAKSKTDKKYFYKNRHYKH